MTDKNEDFAAELTKSLDQNFPPRTHPAATPFSPPMGGGVGGGVTGRAVGGVSASDPYNHLDRILKLAFQQAATGKGAERHATSFIGKLSWDQQPILANARQVGPGGPAMQVQKKSSESVMMSLNSNFEGAKAEALGAIVYAAALFKLYEEMEAALTKR